MARCEKDREIWHKPHAAGQTNRANNHVGGRAERDLFFVVCRLDLIVFLVIARVDGNLTAHILSHAEYGNVKRIIVLGQHTPWWIRGSAMREASAMDPDEHRQLGRLGVDVVLCETTSKLVGELLARLLQVAHLCGENPRRPGIVDYNGRPLISHTCLG